MKKLTVPLSILLFTALIFSACAPAAASPAPAATDVPTLTEVTTDTTADYCVGQTHSDGQGNFWVTNADYATLITSRAGVAVTNADLVEQAKPKEIVATGYCDGTLGTGGDNKTTTNPVVVTATATATGSTTDTTADYCVGQTHSDGQGNFWVTNADYATLITSRAGVAVTNADLVEQAKPKEIVATGYCDGTLGTGGDNKTTTNPVVVTATATATGSTTDTTADYCVGQTHSDGQGNFWVTNADYATLITSRAGVAVTNADLVEQAKPKEIVATGYCDGTLGTGGDNKTTTNPVVVTATATATGSTDGDTDSTFEPTATDVPVVPANTPIPPAVQYTWGCTTNRGGNNPSWVRYVEGAKPDIPPKVWADDSACDGVTK